MHEARRPRAGWLWAGELVTSIGIFATGVAFMQPEIVVLGLVGTGVGSITLALENIDRDVQTYSEEDIVAGAEKFLAENNY